jgi:hypothetical protein
MKTFKGGEVMAKVRLETQGGGDMKDRICQIIRQICEENGVVVREGNWIVWSRRVSDGYPVPFVILQFKDEKDYADFLSAENKDKFLADRLGGGGIDIPDEEAEDGWDFVRIPPYTTKEGYRNPFWWEKENVYETPEEAYKRIYEDRRDYLLEMWLRWPIETIREEISIEEIEIEAKIRADGYFTGLVVVEL